ncbi:MAG: hypothetical protein ABW122_05685 [Ilumatobacteraceae bacterium]
MASYSELVRRSVVVRSVVVCFVVTIAACSSDGDPAPTAASYLSGLQAVCADTATALAALPDPPDGISVTDFATQASTILRDEAESIRALASPDDLDDDHRALIRNDEEQAAAWSDVADTAGGPDVEADSLDALTTTIAELNLGRNDLVVEMGAPSCVRTPG